MGATCDGGESRSQQRLPGQGASPPTTTGPRRSRSPVAIDDHALRGPDCGGLEQTQRSADIGQRVPILAGRTVVRRARRLAGVGDRIPELSVHAVERLCRTDPCAEQRRGGDGSGRKSRDGRAACEITHEFFVPENSQFQTRSLLLDLAAQRAEDQPRGELGPDLQRYCRTVLRLRPDA